jgi:hypothetical protein
MATLAAKKCPNCGAPVPRTPGQLEATCQYCGNLVQFEAPRAATLLRPATASRSGVAARVVLALVVTLAGLGAVVGFAVFRSQVVSVADVAGGLKLPFATTQDFPLTCGLNQELLIENRKFDGSGTLVNADINCKIKIKNSTLKGDIVVRAKNLVEVSVENSVLEGKETAVKLEMNSKLFASKKSQLLSPDTAVDAGINTEISLDDSTIVGGETGIKADTNFKLRASKSTVKGKKFAIRGDNSVDVEGRELSLVGGRVALESEINLKADLRGGSVEGGEAAIHLKGPNAELKLSNSARLSARETALKTSSNLSLEMEDALIDGGEIGVDTEVNPKLKLGQKARIHGKQIALKVGVNLELDMRGASLESEGVALCAPFNIEISARDSTIRGATGAFRFQRRPNELTLTQTTVTGAQLFSARGCGN